MLKNIFPIVVLQIIAAASLAQNTTDVVLITPSGFTESENSVFISPLNNSNVLNANNRKETTTGFPLRVAAETSTNAGFSWTDRDTFLNTTTVDPAVVIDRNGYYYVAFVTPLKIAKSTDNGANWMYSTVNAESSDKEHLWVDNKVYKADGTTNSYQSQLYSAYRRTNTNEIRATFYSGSWSSPITISTGLTADWHQGVNVQTGPDPVTLSQMNVYACWGMHNNGAANEKDEFAIGFNKSINGGSSWGTATKIVDNISGIPAFHALGSTTKTMHVNSFPCMTVNPQNGYIFIVWSNYSNGGSCSFPTNCDDDPNIYMIKSTDGGATWTSGANAIKVNQDNSGNDQWFPWIACDEASGALVCIYYDSRDDNSLVETYVSISYDQGDTWTDTEISDVSWNGVPPTSYVTYAGDYIGVDVYHGKAVAVWTDKRGSPGNLLSYANPFDVPCPPALDLTYGDYYITNEKSNTVFTYDAAYSASSTINVSGNTSDYKIYNGANVLMTAGSSITINEGFECNGEFTADILSSCPNGGDFSQRVNGNQESLEATAPNLSLFELAQNNFPVKIYPNPSSNGKLQSYIPLITADEKDPDNPEFAFIFIYNSIGEQVYNRQAIEWVNELDLSGQPAGFYLIKVVKGDKIYNGKIILK